MRLSLHILGTEVFAISTDPLEVDFSRDLSGGTLSSDRIEAGVTDRYMGFTGGWEGDGE